MITGLSHVSLVVPSLETACARLRQTYGLEVGPVQVNAQQAVRLAYVELGNARLELVEPTEGNTTLRRFLERQPGGGLHHVSLAVDSLESVRARLATEGIQPVSAPGARNVHGESIAFIHPRDFLGALLELEERTET